MTRTVRKVIVSVPLLVALILSWLVGLAANPDSPISMTATGIVSALAWAGIALVVAVALHVWLPAGREARKL